MHEEAEDEPGHGNLDVIQRALGGIALAAEAGEDAGEGPPQRPPLEGQRQQPADHQHRGPRPERPGADVAEAADDGMAVLLLSSAWSATRSTSAGSAFGPSLSPRAARMPAGWSAGRESLASHVMAVGASRLSTSASTSAIETCCLPPMTPCNGLGEPSSSVGAFRSSTKAGQLAVNRGARPGVAKDAGAHRGGKLGIGLQFFGRGKLGTPDGLFKLDGKRLPGLDRQRQLRRGDGLDLRRRVVDDLLLDQSRREDSVVDDQPQQHAQAHLHAEQRADAEEDQARLQAEGEFAQGDAAEAPRGG